MIAHRTISIGEPSAGDTVRIEDVIARIASRLRLVRGSLRPLEFEALAHDLVLEVTQFVLRWAEEGSADGRDLEPAEP